MAGDTVTVTWDSRVTPSHEIRALGISEWADAFVSIDTTDPDPPTFTITGTQQTPGLGGDSFDVEFSGAHVVDTTAPRPRELGPPDQRDQPRTSPARC